MGAGPNGRGLGASVWRFIAGHRGQNQIRSTPALLDDRVYFGSRAGNVHCLDTASGKEIWRFIGADSVESSPSFVADLRVLFIGLNHSLVGRLGSVVALSPITGKKVWEYSVNHFVNSTPIYNSRHGVLACGTDGGVLLLIDPKACKALWNLHRSW